MSGEVRFDAGARAAYSADASNYRQVPIGVVLPRSAADIEATVAVCREHGAPILPRGCGTSLNGQAQGEDILVDVRRRLGDSVRPGGHEACPERLRARQHADRSSLRERPAG